MSHPDGGTRSPNDTDVVWAPVPEAATYYTGSL
jgi:hypothetical protein